MKLLLVLVFTTLLYCVPTCVPFTMVGQARGEDSPTDPLKDSIISIEQLQAIAQQLETHEIQSLVENLLNITRRRIDSIDPVMNSPLGQGHNPFLGGQVGAAGGWGVTEPDYCVSNQGRGDPNPFPSFGPTQTPHFTDHSNHPYQQDTLRGNVGVEPSYVDHSTLQASLHTMGEGLVKAMLKEGVLRQDTPTLPPFSGKAGNGKPAWRRWELHIKGLIGVYSDRAIKDAINRALQGDAAIVADSLDDNCTWQELLEALKSKFANVSSWDAMMRKFYSINQGSRSVSQFAIQLEKVLGNIRVNYPKKLSEWKFNTHLRDRFFAGLNKPLRTNLRFKYNQECSYPELVVCAREIESESKEDPDKVSDSSSETELESAAKQNVEAMQDLRKLQHAHRVSQGELTKLQHHIKELQKVTTFSIASQVSGQQSPPVQNKKARLKQKQPKAQPSQSLDQNKKGYNNLNCSSNKNRNRGFGRRGTRQMVDPPGKPEGWARLCYWCRDHVPFEKANHLVKDCPFFQQEKIRFLDLTVRVSIYHL